MERMVRTIQWSGPELCGPERRSRPGDLATRPAVRIPQADAQLPRRPAHPSPVPVTALDLAGDGQAGRLLLPAPREGVRIGELLPGGPGHRHPDDLVGVDRHPAGVPGLVADPAGLAGRGGGAPGRGRLAAPAPRPPPAPDPALLRDSLPPSPHCPTPSAPSVHPLLPAA